VCGVMYRYERALCGEETYSMLADERYESLMMFDKRDEGPAEFLRRVIWERGMPAAVLCGARGM